MLWLHKTELKYIWFWTFKTDLWQLLLTWSYILSSKRYTVHLSHLSNSLASVMIVLTSRSKLICSWNKLLANESNSWNKVINKFYVMFSKHFQVKLHFLIEYDNWRNVFIITWFFLYSKIDTSNNCAFWIPIPQNVR